MRRSLTAVAAVLLLAGCSNATTSAKNSQARPTPTPSAPSPTASASSSPSASGASPSASRSSGTASNITLSGQGRYLPPGPFKITPVKCGRYTAAEKTKLGTNANGGLIFTYTNQGNTLTDSVDLSVNFLNGNNVAGNNVSGATTQIGPGQTATASVDAVGGSGTDLTFSTCEIMQYMLPEGGATFGP